MQKDFEVLQKELLLMDKLFFACFSIYNIKNIYFSFNN